MDVLRRVSASPSDAKPAAPVLSSRSGAEPASDPAAPRLAANAADAKECNVAPLPEAFQGVLGNFENLTSRLACTGASQSQHPSRPPVDAEAMLSEKDDGFRSDESGDTDRDSAADGDSGEGEGPTRLIDYVVRFYMDLAFDPVKDTDLPVVKHQFFPEREHADLPLPDNLAPFVLPSPSVHSFYEVPSDARAALQVPELFNTVTTDAEGSHLFVAGARFFCLPELDEGDDAPPAFLLGQCVCIITRLPLVDTLRRLVQVSLFAGDYVSFIKCSRRCCTSFQHPLTSTLTGLRSPRSLQSRRRGLCRTARTALASPRLFWPIQWAPRQCCLHRSCRRLRMRPPPCLRRLLCPPPADHLSPDCFPQRQFAAFAHALRFLVHTAFAPTPGGPPVAFSLGAASFLVGLPDPSCAPLLDTSLCALFELLPLRVVFGALAALLLEVSQSRNRNRISSRLTACCLR